MIFVSCPYLAFAVYAALAITSGCSDDTSMPGDGGGDENADDSLVDHPVDEYGYSIVGVDDHPPLYQRVEAKCETPVEGLAHECAADDDCASGFVCICGHQLGRSLQNECMPAECRSAADCNSGRCLLSLDNSADASGHTGLVCSRSASTCKQGGDCVGNGTACVYDEALDLFECKLSN